MHALKIESIDMNEIDATDLADFMKQQLETIAHDTMNVEPIECRRRDGFIPFSHNNGGYRCHSWESIHSGYASDAIEKWLERDREDCFETFLKNHTDLKSTTKHEDLTEDQERSYEDFEMEWNESYVSVSYTHLTLPTILLV